jgi:DNA-binding transcriptional regulator WhiA
MLLASEIKGELARIHPPRRCCQRAELIGLTFAASSARELRTFDHATARIAVQLASSLGIGAAGPMRGEPGPPRRGRRHLQVSFIEPVADGWRWEEAPGCDRRAFLRGVVLANGSLSLGAMTGPHVEFVVRSEDVAETLLARLAEVGVQGHTGRRRGRWVVYLKGNEEVSTLLRLTGANRGLLDFETGRVGREVRNRLNRLMNAEAANVARTVRAADRQLQAIARLEESGELAELSRGLREVAQQRRLLPEADLDDLARVLGVSRSAVNHRLRRLVEMGAATRTR